MDRKKRVTCRVSVGLMTQNCRKTSQQKGSIPSISLILCKEK